MGSTYTVPDKLIRHPLPPKNTEEMKLNVDKMYDLISRLTEISDELYIGRVSDDKKKELIKIFPEFALNNTGPDMLHSITRLGYTNNIFHCCRNNKLKSYWVDDNGIISDVFKPGFVLNSCDPDIHNTNYCDNDLFNWCKDTNKSDKNICNNWLYSLLNRKTSVTTINKLVDLCSKNAATPLCESFIYSLRSHSTEVADNIIDYILYLQTDEFKNNNMKCSYPSEEKLVESLKYSEFRECWDPECENANINFLLSKNYKNLGLCTIDRCNVSINKLNIDNVSHLRMGCVRKDNTINKPVNKEKIIKHNIDNSLNLRLHEITLLSILIIWLLIVAI
ncbi:MV entry-fusion complex protein [Cotia virus SPAn232]|uniref:MV entry-fusion complex protein n=2 Tax=Cotia virus TaxID=39444 RepID=H6TA51_9POXV|nr:MV entry-fusion complex protein [Cotia virus SPAn232]ADT91091.1 MV entry-fusion complex protein [Cotia virus SPAn232]AIT70690.1 MV entry-fusion complex protein [Cotia virus]